MGALIFVVAFMFMLVGGFITVDFINKCIKVYEKELGE
ncbi:hypothetical protein AVV20_gp35 [Bacillus phage Palmer]|uniref:Uncharacterized protein n=3 Tax=Pagevirus TaxID=1921184 RepID=A0A0A0RNN3_9CAUD|nr:hypothetical protein Pony_34 [Bacillus phage Pony]YP_009152834.1 hypothetical protein CPT_Pookie35 [Bacillus phage Pookie]YP_009197504.1 hypothetical protein AVT25_gp35 [Bacillus phage Pavlov]YP_009210070.1 hypothetical protein AVV20_gp35 [Bacillus phage Palmer]AGY48275.1 hypothetical protein Pony_34 [Bacillus phage Pony]AIW03720.1 hypothetical protein CPT_Pookie35 [Bacillus phage Pookie]AJK28102.1 hypothetical protein CPT_Palmer35 [Bacillus phage Palmer]AKQ07456.1 hypothetical protein CP